MVLRPYQISALNAVFNRKINRGIIALPTGCGKSVVASELHQVLNTNQILYLAHREELIDQLAEHMERVHGWGMVGIEQANRKCDTASPIVVASVPTLTACNGKRLKRLGTDRFQAIVVDEAHHSTADSYRQIWRFHGILNEDDSKPANPRIPLIGLTATPGRGDGVGLNQVFDDIIYQMKLAQAIRDGWLVPVHAWTIKTDTDLSQVRTRMGEYVESELAAAVSTTQRNSLILDAYQKQAHGLKTLIFCVNVEHSVKLSEYFSDAGIPARYVAGTIKKEERADILKWFADTPGAVLTNCQIVTEGVDIPSVECVIMARPTKSATLYAQCLDLDTEVLTPEGFKKEKEIHDSDLVAAFDIKTGFITWKPVICKYLRATQDDLMVSYKSPSLDIRVTDKHRMVVRERKGRSRKRTEWSIENAGSLVEKHNEFEIPCAGLLMEGTSVPLTDDELRFIGWVMTDGTIGRINKQIIITQSAHQPFVSDIEKCLIGCGFKYRKSSQVRSTQFSDCSEIVRFTVSYGMPRGEDKHLRGWGQLDKYVDKNFSEELMKLDERQLGILLESIHMGDGWKQPNVEWKQQSYHIVTGNKTFADHLQMTCILHGWKCNIANKDSKYYVVHIKKGCVRYIGAAYSNDRPRFGYELPSSEVVWCVENELGTIITRRNGKVAFMGNCLGRGTRLAKGAYDYSESVKLGKDRCILLDIADTAEVGKRAVNVCDLFGSPFPDRPCAGEDILDVVEQQEKEAQDESDARETAIAESMDLFSGALDIPGTKFSWFGSDQSIRLNLGKHGVITASSDVLDRWTASYWDKSTKTTKPLIFSGADRSEFLNNVETWIEVEHSDCVGLIKKDSKWRNDKPSPKQTDLCKRLGVFLPPNATKGMVSLALDNYFNKQNKRRAM